MPYFVAHRVTSSFNNRMVQSDGIKSTRTTVNIKRASLQIPRLQSYPGVIAHLRERYANDKAIAEADTAILRFTRPATTMPLQYGKALVANAICVGDV